MEVKMTRHGLITVLAMLGLCLIRQGDGACTWPVEFQSSQWYDSTRGVLTFGTNNMQGWGFQPTSNTTVSSWECVSTSTYATDGRIIMVTSQSFKLFATTDYYAYLCLSVTKVTDSSYSYYVDHPVLSNLHNERLFIYIVNTLTDHGTICSDNGGASGPEYQMLVQLGKESQAKVDCPWSFLGRYGYTHMTSSTTTCDATTSELDACSDSKEMRFDYSTCPAQVARSNSNVVWCVNSVPIGDANYVMVYNGIDDSSIIDDVNTFRFSCLALFSDNSAASISPRHCQSDQTPDDFPRSSTGLLVPMGAKVQFTAPIETCPTCPVLSHPERGSVAIATAGSVTSATYTCDSGYTLWGSPTRVCKNDDTWTEAQPYCNCAVPSTPINGDVTVSSDGTMATYSCDVGYSLDGLVSRNCDTNTSTWEGNNPYCAPCQDFISVAGQTVITSTNGLVTSAWFSCASGYTLNGNPSLTCTSSGAWDNGQPHCVSCGLLSNPQSGSVTLTSDGSTTTAVYTCSIDYYLHGTTSRTCLMNGTWDGTEPSCLCSEPVSPVNGAVVSNGSDATYSCNVGFTLSAAAVRTCQGDGSGWSDSDPTCTQCESLGMVSGGAYTLSSTSTVTSAKYSCDNGYSLNGPSSISCEAGGTWNNVPPKCVICLPLTNPDSGSVTLSTSGSKTSATYTCSSGYNLIGNAISLCNSDGTWTLSPPVCTCQSPTTPWNGVVTDDGVTATYTCDVGYTINGPSSRSCAPDGSGWSSDDPTCSICQALATPDGGAVVMRTDGQVTQADFTCFTGYTLKGISTTSCGSDGNWDFPQPTCAQCPDRQDPASGTVTVATTGSVTTATYACQTGYYISGAYLLTCHDNGTWDNAEPTCKCNFPTTPSNGAVSVSDGSGSTTATYSCDTGYSLKGLATRVCQGDGSGWESDSPSCTVCRTVDQPVSGTISLASNGTHTQAMFTCDIGTTLFGSSALTCQSTGSWRGNVPTCVNCATLSSSANGVINLETDGLKTKAVFSCATGYRLNTTGVLTCLIDGTWNLPEPVCYCEEPPRISNGDFTISNSLGKVTYRCNQGYILSGSRMRTCNTDGSGWSGQAPSCEIDSQLNVGRSTQGGSSNTAYIVLIVLLLLLLIAMAVLLFLFIYKYCKLRRQKTARVGSSANILEDTRKVATIGYQETETILPGTVQSSLPPIQTTLGTYQKMKKSGPGSTVTTTDVALPLELSPGTPRSHATNGLTSLPAIRLPKMTSRPPVCHEIDTAIRISGESPREETKKRSKSQKRSRTPKTPKTPKSPKSTKTPQYANTDISSDPLIGSDLLGISELNYSNPAYRYGDQNMKVEVENDDNNGHQVYRYGDETNKLKLGLEGGINNANSAYRYEQENEVGVERQVKRHSEKKRRRHNKDKTGRKKRPNKQEELYFPDLGGVSTV